MTKCKRNHGKFHEQSFLVPKSNGKGLKAVKQCDYIIAHKLQDGKGSKQSLLCRDLPMDTSLPTGYVLLSWK